PDPLVAEPSLPPSLERSPGACSYTVHADHLSVGRCQGTNRRCRNGSPYKGSHFCIRPVCSSTCSHARASSMSPHSDTTMYTWWSVMHSPISAHWHPAC